MHEPPRLRAQLLGNTNGTRFGAPVAHLICLPFAGAAAPPAKSELHSITLNSSLSASQSRQSETQQEFLFCHSDLPQGSCEQNAQALQFLSANADRSCVYRSCRILLLRTFSQESSSKKILSSLLRIFCATFRFSHGCR